LLVCCLAALAFAPPARADALDDVRKRGELRWGGDEEGGGPYIYRSEDDAKRLTGFEVDLMAYLAERIGVRAQFTQCQWDDLPKLLQSGGVDVVVNGYELTPERLRNQIATIPYYVYELHLFAGADDPTLTGWSDLTRSKAGGGRWKVGVLRDTVADKYLTKTYSDHVEVVRYSGTTEAFREVVNRNLDATLTDTPAAVFYGPQFKVRQVGLPVERGYYVMYLRKGDERLRDRLNDGLRAALKDGRLRAILGRYRLWNDTQEALSTPEVQNKPQELEPKDEGEGNWSVVGRAFPLFLDAAVMTIKLSLTAMPLAIVIGLLVALGRLYGPWVVRAPLTVYVEFLRGTPLLLQLLFVYYGVLPLFPWPDGVRDYLPFLAAVAALAINYSAYEAEIYRAGLLAIPAGQMEAALALGLSRRQSLRHVVVPQAVRLVVPPVTNDFIALFKDTAICSVLPNMVELTKQYQITSNNYPRAFLEVALVTSALYLVMSYPLSLLTRRLERRVPQVRH
jgi:polar amino acid transport system substrate-binding protein